MLRVITLSAVLFLASAFAYGETFTGRLVDANCAAQQSNAVCAPTDSTTSFALVVSGKAMKLDADGNKKAADALKASNSSANRSKDANASAAVSASVEGTKNGDEIQVQSIQIQ